MRKSACISPDGRYRYRLGREWHPLGSQVVFIMLNPSTADATRDDPTIRRCIGFANSWGHGSLAVVNLFAYRTSSPKCLLQESDPVGPDNDVRIQAAAHQADCVVCAWGSFVGKSEELRARAAFVRRVLLGNLTVHCLGMTKDGHPRHPLYVRKEAEPIPLGEVPGGITRERS